MLLQTGLIMFSKVYRKINELAKQRKNRRQANGKIKYFCIGHNKTGTTSIKKAFEDLRYPVGHQWSAEKLAEKYYFKGNFAPIISYCESAQVFQDIPFSWPDTFRHLDRAYAGSKFILTLRDDAEQWYQSLTRFHAKLFGNGSIPTVDDLKAAKYVRKGFMYSAVKLYGALDDDIYNKEILIGYYNRYNQTVQDYFKARPGDLLVLNLAEDGSYLKFIGFLGIESPFSDFPWENKT